MSAIGPRKSLPRSEFKKHLVRAHGMDPDLFDRQPGTEARKAWHERFHLDGTFEPGYEHENRNSLYTDQVWAMNRRNAERAARRGSSTV